MDKLEKGYYHLEKSDIARVERSFYHEIARFLVDRWLRDLLILALILAGAWCAFYCMKQYAQEREFDAILTKRRAERIRRYDMKKEEAKQ